MALKLSGQLFTGPFPVASTTVRPNQQPVVFAILAKGGPGWAPTFRVVDVGFSEDKGIVFAEHPDRGKWTPAAGEDVSVYLFYAAKSDYSRDDRERIANEIRQKYTPPTGFVEG